MIAETILYEYQAWLRRSTQRIEALPADERRLLGQLFEELPTPQQLAGGAVDQTSLVSQLQRRKEDLLRDGNPGPG